MGSSLPWTSSLLSRTNPPASELIPTVISIPPNDCTIINCKLLLIDHQDRRPANDSSFFRLLPDCGVDPPNDDSAKLADLSSLHSPFSLGKYSCIMTSFSDHSPSLLTTPLAFAVDIHSLIVSSFILSYRSPAHYFSIALGVG